MSAQDRELLVQSVREAARSQQIMAGRIADELREVYRNLDLRPQIIPVPMPQVMVPQAPPAYAGGGAQAGIPPGLAIAGIPRYAREEELPAEPEARSAEEDWDKAFAGLEPFPEELEGEAAEELREDRPERREGPADWREDRPERREGPVDRREGRADRRETRPERREGPPDRREGPADRREDSAERRKLKDYLAKVREKLASTPSSGMASTPPSVKETPPGGRPKPEAEARPAGQSVKEPPAPARLPRLRLFRRPRDRWPCWKSLASTCPSASLSGGRRTCSCAAMPA